MDDTSKRKNLILDLVLGQREFEKFEWLSVLAILKGDMIDSELGEILSVTAEMKTESSSFALTHSTIKTAAIATIVTITWKPDLRIMNQLC